VKLVRQAHATSSHPALQSPFCDVPRPEILGLPQLLRNHSPPGRSLSMNRLRNEKSKPQPWNLRLQDSNPKLNIFRMDGETSIKFPRERFAEYELTTEYRTRVSWNISEQILWHLPPDKLHLQILLWKLTLSFCLGGHVCFYTDWQQLVVVSVRNWLAGGTSW